MIRTFATIGLATMLAACGGGTAPSNEAATNAATGNEAALNYQAAVMDLTPEQRNVVMIRAITDAGIDCQQVTRSEQIKGEGLTYRAWCGEASHVVSISPDGNGQVISASPTKGG